MYLLREASRMSMAFCSSLLILKKEGKMINIKNEIPQLKLGIFVVNGVIVKKKKEKLWKEVEDECKRLTQEYQGKNLGEIKEVQAVRKLYSSVGMDPTHFRPSSEALLRRVLKNQKLYQINTVVDVNNLCSLKFLLPMGVYDLGEIVGDLTIRLGKAGEFYQGIGKERVNSEGRIIMVDQEKICGGPTADSVETMITLETKDIILTMYAPSNYSNGEINEFLKETAETMVVHNGGVIEFKSIVSK